MMWINIGPRDTRVEAAFSGFFAQAKLLGGERNVLATGRNVTVPVREFTADTGCFLAGEPRPLRPARADRHPDGIAMHVLFDGKRTDI